MKSSLSHDILELRRRAHSGNFIDQHRAFRRVGNRMRISWSAVLLVAALTIAVVIALPAIAQLWGGLLLFVAPVIGLGDDIAFASRTVLPFVSVDVPFLAAQVAVPGRAAWSAALVFTIVLLIGSLLIPRRMLPLIYLMRLAVIIQLVSLAYFMFYAERFPYTLPRYLSDMHTIGLAIISVVPILFGLTYFVFDFGPARKLLLVVLTIAHLTVFIPLQYLVHAAVVNVFSMAFLPVLFMLFGTLLDVAVIIALYGWGMSWRDRTERMAGAPVVRTAG